MKEELAAKRGLPNIVGDDPRLRKVITTLQRAAESDATVLLGGESGTGKELFARALHAYSGRSEGPFVAINCAAIPESLLESELFGHEKDAFTGAATRKPGKFEVAHRGTLFLDEIGEMPLPLQAKILRAIEEKTFERVGGTAALRVDVRLVAATNKDLQAAVAAKQFREDLFFRLSVFPITVPALRDRPTGIPILARYFVDRFCKELKKTSLELSPDALETMLTYAWPGNVRELQNCIERAVILCEDGQILTHHLNLSAHAVPEDKVVHPWDHIDLSGSLPDVSRRVQAEAERVKIERVLEEVGGDRGLAADQLKIGYRVLLAKLKEYGIG